jgi:hypothetical protein
MEVDMAFLTEKTPEEIIDDDFDRFEMLLKRLEVEYNAYLQGGRKNPPDEYTRMVKELVLKYRNMTLKRSSHRFRFATIMSKYSTYAERWARKVREKEVRDESGEARHLTSAQRATMERLGVVQQGPQDLDAAETAASAPAGRPARPAPGAPRSGYAISDPKADRAALEGLFNRYVEAKRAAGEDVAKIKMASFEKTVTKQVDALKAKGAAGAQFQVETRDGKVVLKAARTKS